MNASIERREIVVGVDGSASSMEALHWAIREAAMLGALVRVVTAWHATRSERDRAAREGAAERIALGAAGRHAHQGVRVAATTARGDAADVLVEASRGALMLVVGSRGRGLIAGTVLGSVALGCLRHAACPVVVVRDGRRPVEQPARLARADAVLAQPPPAEDRLRPVPMLPLSHDDAQAALRKHLAAQRYRYERQT